jgi:hypothetical protein
VQIRQPNVILVLIQTHFFSTSESSDSDSSLLPTFVDEQGSSKKALEMAEARTFRPPFTRRASKNDVWNILTTTLFVMTSLQQSSLPPAQPRELIREMRGKVIKIGRSTRGAGRLNLEPVAAKCCLPDTWHDLLTEIKDWISSYHAASLGASGSWQQRTQAHSR